MTRIVLAVDVGYGNVKAAWGAECTHATETLFRSIAVPVEASFSTRSTMNSVPVTVRGDTFLVGPDAYLSEASGIADSNFVGRKEYLAFLRGAMHYMFTRTGVYHKIDVLAVGLPVGNYENHQEALHDICVGEHIIPTPSHLVPVLGRTVKVHVDNAIVIPQPFGALSVYATKCARADKNMGSTLIIDPGYKTLDWVFSHGMNVDMARSGSFAGGVSALLREISATVGKKLGVGYIDSIEVEKALTTSIIFADGCNYDFTPFNHLAKEAAARVIDKFFGALQINRQFNTIVLTGGGSKYYREAIAKKFPTHVIQCEDDSVMDNVRGFYTIARGSMP